MTSKDKLDPSNSEKKTAYQGNYGVIVGKVYCKTETKAASFFCIGVHASLVGMNRPKPTAGSCAFCGSPIQLKRKKKLQCTQNYTRFRSKFSSNKKKRKEKLKHCKKRE